MPNMRGVGKDAETVREPNGARHSASPYRFDLLPPLAMAAIAEVLRHGADKYGEWSFLDLPLSQHLNHAMQHLFAWTAGDETEASVVEHLRHAACRMVFALEVAEREEQVTAQKNAMYLCDATEDRNPTFVPGEGSEFLFQHHNMTVRLECQEGMDDKLQLALAAAVRETLNNARRGANR